MSKYLETNPHYLNSNLLRQCSCLVATRGGRGQKMVARTREKKMTK